MAVTLPSSKPDLVVELVHAVEKTEIIYNACQLKLFDIIHDLNKPCTTDEIIEAMGGGNANLLGRLLNACASLKLLTKTFDDDVAVYSNTNVSESYLTSTSTYSLLTLVAAARHQFPIDEIIKKDTHDSSRRWFYNVEENNQAYEKIPFRFNRYYLKQESYAKTSLHLLKAFDLSKYNSVVDLGGGTGALCRTLATMYPHMKVTNVDMPKVIEFAKKRAPDTDEIDYYPADILCDSLPNADLYIVGHLIHMYNDEAAKTMLRKVNAHIKKGGAILLLEKLLNDRCDGPEMATMYDIRMCTGMLGGRERTRKEYTNILQHAGFDNLDCFIDEGCSCYDAIIADKTIHVPYDGTTITLFETDKEKGYAA